MDNLLSGHDTLPHDRVAWERYAGRAQYAPLVERCFQDSPGQDVYPDLRSPEQVEAARQQALSYQAAQAALVEEEAAAERSARERDLTGFLAGMTSYEQPEPDGDTTVSLDPFEREARARHAQARLEVQETLRLFGGVALILAFLAGVGLALSVGYQIFGVADGPPWALR